MSDLTEERIPPEKFKRLFGDPQADLARIVLYLTDGRVLEIDNPHALVIAAILGDTGNCVRALFGSPRSIAQAGAAMLHQVATSYGPKTELAMHAIRATSCPVKLQEIFSNLKGE